MSTIEEKLTEILVKLERHSVLHEKNTKDLEVHIKRTEILEQEVNKLWKWKWYASGGVAVLSFLVALVVKMKF
jgi:hypothetical protein